MKTILYKRVDAGGAVRLRSWQCGILGYIGLPEMVANEGDERGVRVALVCSDTMNSRCAIYEKTPSAGAPLFYYV